MGGRRILIWGKGIWRGIVFEGISLAMVIGGVVFVLQLVGGIMFFQTRVYIQRTVDLSQVP